MVSAEGFVHFIVAIGRSNAGRRPAARGAMLRPSEKAMDVAIIPCLKDNYAYLLTAKGADRAVVVDPSEADPVLAALEKAGLPLGAILCTHHHPDHVDGNQELALRYPGIEVYGSAHDRGRIPAQNRFVADEEVISTCGLEFRCLLVP